MSTHIASTSRVVLLPTGRRDGLNPRSSSTPVVRRYRLARLSGDAANRSERFGHLKQSHD
jgi:hypothetical protein